MTWKCRVLALGLLALGACSSSGGASPPGPPADSSTADAGEDQGSPDTSTDDQTAEPEASAPDANVEQPDAASDDAEPDSLEPDAGPDSEPNDALACVPLDGLGVVTCVCNELDDAVWSSSTPFLLTDSVDLGSTGWDPTQLTAGGQKIVADGNLGGSSVESEALAYDVLARCEFATLLKSEGEILYTDPTGKKTDELVTIDSRKIGLSVTRAYHYPPSAPCTAEEAQTLLDKKLADIPLSAANAAPADAWERSMLAVVAVSQQCADVYVQVWQQMDAVLKADTILFVTVTDGEDAAIY